MINISEVSGTRVDVRAERGTDPNHNGWVVWVVFDSETRVGTFYADAGGAWRLNRDGTLGRQIAGTSHGRAPRDDQEFAAWLRSRIARDLDSYAIG